MTMALAQMQKLPAVAVSYLTDILRTGGSVMELLLGGGEFWLSCRLVPVAEVADSVEVEVARVAVEPDSLLFSWEWLPPDG